MGAHSHLIAFDFKQHVSVVAPALQVFLNTGEQNTILQFAVSSYFERLLGLLKHSHGAQDELFVLRQRLTGGLGLQLQQVCDRLDHHLGSCVQSIAGQLTLLSHHQGGCDAPTCKAHGICPFNRLYHSTIDSERVMGLVQHLVKVSCLETPPPLLLGKNFQLHHVAWWYGFEMGYEYNQSFFMAAQDELPWLLTCLFKRGGIWGRYDEGVLGWLSADECLRLVAGLAVYDLSEEAAIPDLLSDDCYLCQHTIPELRTAMAQLLDFAHLCGSQKLGILLERS